MRLTQNGLSHKFNRSCKLYNLDKYLWRHTMLVRVLASSLFLVTLNCCAAAESVNNQISTEQLINNKMHALKDALYRTCKAEAEKLNLNSDERSAYIAKCVKERK